VRQATGFIENAVVSEQDFTEEYINAFFQRVRADAIPDCYYHRLRRMRAIFEQMQEESAVWFERCTAEQLAGGHANNVWGFHSMRVLDRKLFDALVVKAASPQELGSQHMVYEVMVEIGGMTVQNRAPAYCGPAPEDKKKLGQESWFFNLGWFQERKQKREPRWAGKRNLSPANRLHIEWVQCENCSKWRQVEKTKKIPTNFTCNFLEGITCDTPQKQFDETREWVYSKK
jgi:hypothetical protein